MPVPLIPVFSSSLRFFSLPFPSSRRPAQKTRYLIIHALRKVPPTGIKHIAQDLAPRDITARLGPEAAETTDVRADGADFALEVLRDVGAEVEGGDDVSAVAAEVAVYAHVDAALGGEALGEVGGVVVGGSGRVCGVVGREGGSEGEGEEGEEGGGEEGFHCYGCWE